MTPELVATLDDLHHLRGLLTDGWVVTDADARRMSAILRRLLIDGELGRSWRALGFAGEPEFKAIDLRRAVVGYPYAKVKVAIAGAPRLKDCKRVGSFINSAHVVPAEKMVEVMKRRANIECVERLTAWLESPGILTRGTFIPRRVVLKFAANQLGGVHFGVPKGKDKPWLRILEDLPDGGAVFGRTPAELKRPVFAEVVAAAQTMAFSDAALEMKLRATMT